MPSENWRAEVCAEALTWYGTPYVPKGRVKGVGVDCGGILYELYNPHFGPFAPMPTNYSADWAVHSDEERYLDFIMPYVHRVPRVLTGGFTLFKVGLAYSHAGIMLPDSKYIHAWGRTREGRVTITPARVMYHMGKDRMHFDPNG